MRLVLIVVLTLWTLKAPVGPPPPMGGCTASDPCPDPSRPWMRGTIEKSCARDPVILKRLRDARPGAMILACECKHVCDPFNPLAEETGGVAWDGGCEARCSPKGCHCPDPCES